VSVAAENGESAGRKAEPVYVFGTDLGGRHEQDSALVAVRLHGAEAGKGSGATGNAYAIPYRNTRLELLPLDVIGNYTESFLRHAASQADTRFQVARFACETGAYGDSEMARLFKGAPRNCRLPGLWARSLDPRLPVRLLVFDPGAHLKDERWQAALQRYLNLNVPLWNAPSVELVSSGTARGVVAADAAARKLGLKHRVIAANEAYYGRNAQFAVEYLAIWYATHLLAIIDFEQTADPQQIRVMGAATRGGLAVDQIDTGTIA
jgi:hypothetical protein